MNIEEMKLKCLELAHNPSKSPEDVISDAIKYYEFVLLGGITLPEFAKLGEVKYI